jgi:dihydroorotate dehydrogenase electron transfer subunit
MTASQGPEAPSATRQLLGEILENRAVAPRTWLMKIHAPDVAPSIRAGQFVNLKTTSTFYPLLRRPMSVHRVIEHAGTATGFCVLYDVIGPGTAALSQMKARERIDFVGPLGNSISPRPDTRRAILVAGGIGVGPIRIVAEELQAAGVRDVTICYGARDADHSVPDDVIAPHGCRVLVCTDDGSVGRKGLVTQFLDELIERGRLTPDDYVFACGPVPMFQAIQERLAPHDIPCEAAAEEYMGCGFGVCFGCVLSQRQPDGEVAYKLCCVDGCVFPLETLVFEGPDAC